MQVSFSYGDLRILLFMGYLIFNRSGYFSPGNSWIAGIWGCVCLYFLIRFMLSFKANLYPLVHLLLLIWGIGEAVYGHLQLYGYYSSNNGLYRLTGSFLNPGPFSGFLASIFPLSIYYVLQAGQQQTKILQLLQGIAWTGLFLTLSLLPAGMSRAAWLATGAGAGVVISYRYRPWQHLRLYCRQHKKAVLPGVCGLLLLLLAAAICIYSLKKDSADGRLFIWQMTTRIITSHPWTGVGAGHFAGAYGEAQAGYFATHGGTPREAFVAGSPEYGFNEFLQITAENGIIGLVLFLAVLFSAFHQTRQNGQSGIAGCLAAFLTFACFSYPFRVPQLNILFTLLLAIAHTQVKPATATLPKKRLLFTGLPLLLFLFPFFRTGQQWQTRQEAVNKWKSEQTYYNMQIYEGTADNYRKLYPALKDDPKFLFELGQCLSKTQAYEASNQILREGTRISSDPMFWNIMGKNHQALKNYEEAEKCFIHAKNMVPHRLYPLYLLANLYFSSNQTQKGIATARLVIAQEPKVMSPAIEEMKAEMQEKLNTFEP